MDPILNWLDDSRPNPKVAVCRFAHRTFSQLIAEYVVAHVINTERGFGRTLVQAQKNRHWITDQIHVTNHRGLNEIKIGILGVGEMGKFIGKTFKVSLRWLVSIIRI